MSGFSSTGFCNISGGPSEIPSHQPLELPDWWLGLAGAKEPRDQQGGTPLDGILGSLLDRCSDQLSGQPSPDLSWEKEGIVTDNLLGAPWKAATVKETWGLGRREAL